MKKILFILLIFPAIACSSTLTKPAANLSTGNSTATATYSPILSITDTAIATASSEACEVIADALHLRDAPSIEGLVIAWLVKGDQLTILTDLPVGDWVKVQTDDDLIGWINSNYCKRKQI